MNANLDHSALINAAYQFLKHQFLLTCKNETRLPEKCKNEADKLRCEEKSALNMYNMYFCK